MKVTLLVPTLNEVDGIKVIMPRVKKEWYDQLIILDGNSTDGTIEAAKEADYFVYIQKNRGLINAYKEVWELIEGDIVITFSPEGNSVPELIPALVDKMREGYDMVIVSRYAPGARSFDDDFITRFGNWLFTKMINVFFNAHYTDSGVIYRAYKKDIVETLDMDKKIGFVEWSQNHGILMGWEPQLSIRCAKRRLRVAEIPGDEPARMFGRRKMHPFKSGATILSQIIYEIFNWR